MLPFLGIEPGELVAVKRCRQYTEGAVVQQIVSR